LKSAAKSVQTSDFKMEKCLTKVLNWIPTPKKYEENGEKLKKDKKEERKEEKKSWSIFQ
jgi:hypothetical protein